MCIKYENGQLFEELDLLCREYHELMPEVGKRQEASAIRVRLAELWKGLEGRIGIDEPGLLLALLDVYEVTGDETMLQNVLNIVSGQAEQLMVSVESVRLLVTCYYYVEEEECAVRAWKMLEELKGRGEDTAKLAETEERLKELL